MHVQEKEMQGMLQMVRLKKIMQHFPAYRSLCTQHEMKPAQLLFLPGYRALLSLVCLDQMHVSNYYDLTL
jgi:hypothetical protein